MRVKVGDRWFSQEINRPIMVELTNQDKIDIGSTPVDLSKYAIFEDNDKNFDTRDKRLAWMKK